MDSFSNEYTLLAMQRALLGEVTAELRAVFIYLDTNENILHARFYYDGEVSEKRIDLWDCAITEASAALGPDCFVKSRIERVDYPQKIPAMGYCAYLMNYITLLIDLGDLKAIPQLLEELEAAEGFEKIQRVQMYTMFIKGRYFEAMLDVDLALDYYEKAYFKK